MSELLGFHLIHVEPGEAVVELEARDHHYNPMGTLHGGVLATIADTSMGIAHSSLLPEGESGTGSADSNKVTLTLSHSHVALP